MDKIKLFLGAYVNFPNAQNINCDNIARYIDKDKFEVHVMYTDKMPIDKEKYRQAGVHLHRLIHHRYIWYWNKIFTMLLGNYDIYYLPKQEPMDRLFAKLFRKSRKVFVSSIEGVVGEQIPADDEAQRAYYMELMDDSFAISRCISESVEKHWGRRPEVLYLGVDDAGARPHVHDRVRRVIWVGSMIPRKRPEFLLDCAEAFPELDFLMLGDGSEQETVRHDIGRRGLKNVTCPGRVPNERVYGELAASDLLLMTSDKEGLPKVIGEAMTMGVPAIYINECYDVDYIDSGVNGFAVSDLEEMKSKLQYLLDNPGEYRKMSAAAEASIQPYLWPKLVKQYEEYFESLVR